jgi:hypothetical protein
MLIDVFDKLTSGKLIRKIVFDDGVLIAPKGMKVGLKDSDENVDAWVCYSKDGITLTSNARVTSSQGDFGMRGFEDPLSTIRDIEFVPTAEVELAELIRIIRSQLEQ